MRPRPNPLKATCVKCKSKIKYIDSSIIPAITLSDGYYLCKCNKVILEGWQLHKEWKLPFWYKLRYKLAIILMGE